jgi:hypothetical protein
MKTSSSRGQKNEHRAARSDPDLGQNLRAGRHPRNDRFYRHEIPEIWLRPINTTTVRQTPMQPTTMQMKMKITSHTVARRKSPVIGDLLDITPATTQLLPGVPAQMSLGIWSAIAGDSAFSPDDTRMRDFLSCLHFAVSGMIAGERKCQRTAGCCWCKWNLTPAVSRYGLRLTGVTPLIEMMGWPETVLLVFLGEYVLQFELQPSQNRLQFV